MATEYMPDIGTLGGNLYDDSGESSVTLGGKLTPEQAYANDDVNSNPWGYDFDSAGFNVPGSFQLGNIFGYNRPQGLPTLGGNYAGNTETYGWDDIERSPFGKLFSTVINAHPLGKAVNVARGVRNAVNKNDPMAAIAGVAGAYGGLPGAVGNAGFQATRGNYGPALGLGGGLAGGAGLAFLGNQVGNAISGAGRSGGGVSSQGFPGGSREGGQGGGLDWEGIIGGLAGLYGNRGGGNISGAQANNDAVSKQIQSLGSMYSPDSPYAQQLRQVLERKDAAAGRRSQYGPREVQLMAALADKQASVSDSMGRLAQTNQANQIALQDRKRLQRGQKIATLGELAKSSGLLDMFKGQVNSWRTPSFNPAPNFNPSPSFNPGAIKETWGNDYEVYQEGL